MEENKERIREKPFTIKNFVSVMWEGRKRGRERERERGLGEVMRKVVTMREMLMMILQVMGRD